MGGGGRRGLEQLEGEEEIRNGKRYVMRWGEAARRNSFELADVDQGPVQLIVTLNTTRWYGSYGIQGKKETCGATMYGC